MCSEVCCGFNRGCGWRRVRRYHRGKGSGRHCRAPEVGVLGAGPISDMKGNLFVDTYLDLLGVAVAS